MVLGRVLLGEGINSNGENCCVKFLRDQFSRLRENFESMCLPHSQWSTKLAHSGHKYMFRTGWVKTTARAGYLLLLNLHNFA